jgi:hypothetical protein
VPFDDGLRFDDDQDLPPIIPELRENHPEESLSPTQLRPVNFPVEDGQLLTQREILCREGCVAKNGCLVSMMVDCPDPESSSEVYL